MYFDIAFCKHNFLSNPRLIESFSDHFFSAILICVYCSKVTCAFLASETMDKERIMLKSWEKILLLKLNSFSWNHSFCNDEDDIKSISQCAVCILWFISCLRCSLSIMQFFTLISLKITSQLKKHIGLKFNHKATRKILCLFSFSFFRGY